MTSTVVSPYSSTESAKEMAKRLPFKIGQEVETKSFSQGYRGAWFACTIVEIDKGGRNQLRYKLKYIHFPEEALHWCQAYQQRHRGQVDSTELMLRPPPPPILHEKDLPYANYDGIVVVPYVWEVGDLVNWWCDDVWWEAVVSEILGHGKVKISLWKPPLGEGGVHIANAVELRPSMSWSHADHWTIPISKKKPNGMPAARIIELSSKRWLKTPEQQADCIGLKKESSLQGHFPSMKSNGSVQNIVDGAINQVDQSISAASHLPVIAEQDNDSKWISATGTRTVPCLDGLRVAAEPHVNATCPGEQHSGKGNLQHLSTEEIFHSETCTGSDTMEDDSEDLADALRLKWHKFKIRNRKFKRYRKHVNRAVELTRRKRFNMYIFTDCKILDSSDGEV